MADKNVVQHIDKISYAVAGVVGLVLLVLPVVSGGNLAETRIDLNEAVDDLATRKQVQDFPTLPVRGLKAEIQEQWKPGSGGESQTWITGAAPCLLKRAMSVQQRAATHSPGTITEISAHRDSGKKQVYLIVKGAMGADNEFVTIDSVRLSRREGDAGSFRLVVGTTFKGDFEYKDFRVKAGETYSYMFTSIASRDSTAPSNILPPDVPEQESEELATPAIPYDFSVKVRQTFEGENLGERPTVMADFKYWDYVKDALVPKNLARFTEKDVEDNRYMIFTVDPSKRSILVKDGLRRTKHTITSRDDPFPVELWPPVSAVVEDAPSEDELAEDEIEVADPADPATAPAPTTPARPRGFRKFK